MGGADQGRGGGGSQALNRGNMENNRTTPANSPNTRPVGFRPIRSFMAVAAGVLTDLGGTNAVAACYALVIAMPMARLLAAQGLSQTEMLAQLTKSLNQATQGSFVVIVLGILLSILGGFVAGKIAGYAEVIHGLASGLGVTLVSTTLTLLFHFPLGNAPLWQLLVSLLINWGAPTIGGYLAQLQRARSNRKLAAVAQGTTSTNN